MEKNNSKDELVFSVSVNGLKVSWAAKGCSVENVSLKRTLISALDLEKYIRSLGVLSNVQMIDRFDSDGSTWIEIRTVLLNEELTNVDGKIESIRRAIFQHMTRHNEILSGYTNSNNQYAGTDENHAAIEALAKCFFRSEDKKFELDFVGAGKLIIKTTKQVFAKIASKINEDATGVVRYFDELHEKVALHLIVGMPGGIMLDVEDKDMRNHLVMAQLERRQVTVKFLPVIDPTRPDKNTREGVLVEIVHIGRSQCELALVVSNDE